MYVTEVSLDGEDTIQHEIEEEDVEEEGISVQYEIEDHQYISQAGAFHRLKEVRQPSTKYIICSPDENLGTFFPSVLINKMIRKLVRYS